MVVACTYTAYTSLYQLIPFPWGSRVLKYQLPWWAACMWCCWSLRKHPAVKNVLKFGRCQLDCLVLWILMTQMASSLEKFFPPVWLLKRLQPCWKWTWVLRQCAWAQWTYWVLPLQYEQMWVCVSLWNDYGFNSRNSLNFCDFCINVNINQYRQYIVYVV